MSTNSIFHFSGYVISAIGAVFGVAFLSHVVSAEHYGVLALYISFASLMQHVVRETTGNALMRYSDELNANKFTAIYIIRANLYRLGFFFLATSIFSIYWFDGHGFYEKALSVLLCFFLAASVVGETLLSALLKRKECAVYININQWFRFLLAGVFYIFLSDSVNALLMGFVVTFALSLLFVIYIFLRHESPGDRVVDLNFNIFDGYSPFLIGVLSWYFLFFDRLIVEQLLGAELLGVFFILIQIGFMPAVMLLRALSNYLFPLLFSSDKRNFGSLSFAITILILLSIVFLFVFHGWIFSWLVGSEYRPYSWLLPWMFVAAVVHTLAYLFQAKFFQVGGMVRLLNAQALGAFVSLAAIVSLTMSFGLVGAVFAKVIVSMVLILFSVVFYRIYKHNH